MKTYQTIIYLSTLLIFSINGAHTQNSIVSSGGDANGSNGSVSFSIGQVCYATVQGSNTSISQGVQQPFEIMNISIVQEFPFEICSVVIFPNPTTNSLMISVQSKKSKEHLTYQLYDSNGKIIETKIIHNENEQINMCELLPSVYFLKIFQENIEVNSLKIIKK